jgi:hypothetical protein
LENIDNETRLLNPFGLGDTNCQEVMDSRALLGILEKQAAGEIDQAEEAVTDSEEMLTWDPIPISRRCLVSMHAVPIV